MKLPPLADYRKGLVVIGQVGITLLALGVLHGTVETWTIVIVNVLGATGVIAVRNGAKPV